MIRELSDVRAYLLVEVEEALRPYATPHQLSTIMSWLVGYDELEERALQGFRSICNMHALAAETVLEATSYTRSLMHDDDHRWMSNYDVRQRLVACFEKISTVGR